MSVDSLIGRKLGMTSVFDAGCMLGVTVLEVLPNRVLQRRTGERDGRDAVALAYGARALSRGRRPQLVQAAVAGLDREPRVVRETAVAADSELAVGSDVTVADVFSVGDWVDVSGTSRGHGHQGVRKRYHHAYGRATHGSKSYREPGSTGMCTTPGRVFKGKKMAGRMGGKARTIRNLRVVRVDAERNLLLVAGPVPGWDTGTVVVRKAVAKRIAKGN